MNFDNLTAQVDWHLFVSTVIQIFIITYAGLWVWGRIRGTQAERLVKGVIILGVIFLASYFLEFKIITSLLQHIIPVAVMAMFVVFQPEIRRGLGYLGRVKTIRADLSLASSEAEKLKRDVTQIIAAVKELSRHKTGALIVIEPPEGERDYVSPGTPVNADISMNLLLSLFFPKSPLHDGAVVIRKGKIVAAGVILPMTADPKLSYRYGTRHRAAIGLSEIYDGLCIVVSEETGSISAASRGMLVRYHDAEELQDPIEYLYHTPETAAKTITNPWVSFLNLFKKGSEPQAVEQKNDAPAEETEQDSLKEEELSSETSAPQPQVESKRKSARSTKSRPAKPTEQLDRPILRDEDVDELPLSDSSLKLPPETEQVH